MVTPSTFDPVARRTVSSEIRERLLAAIRSGELIPGTSIPPERVLCDEFGVARTSVREAIQGLVTAGYLDRRGNRPVVAERLPDMELHGDDVKSSVRDLFEVRRVIEPAIAEFAASRASAEQRAELSRLAAEHPRDLEEFRAIDRRFHATMSMACGNPLLAEVHAKALSALFGSGRFASLLYAGVDRTEAEDIIRTATDAHRAIASAMARGDRRATRRATVEHLADVERRMTERLQ